MIRKCCSALSKNYRAGKSEFSVGVSRNWQIVLICDCRIIATPHLNKHSPKQKQKKCFQLYSRWEVVDELFMLSEEKNSNSYCWGGCPGQAALLFTQKLSHYCGDPLTVERFCVSSLHTVWHLGLLEYMWKPSQQRWAWRGALGCSVGFCINDSVYVKCVFQWLWFQAIR